MTRRRILATAIAATAMATTGVAAVPAARANAPIVVTTTADVVNAGDGLTSLREAITRANAAVGFDTIQLAVGAQYRITACGNGDENANAAGDLDSTDVAGIEIAGRGSVIANTCARQRVLETTGLTLMTWTTVRSGHAVGDGGGVLAHDLTLQSSTVESSDATGSGGGIRARGELRLLSGSMLRNNRAAGWGGGAAVSDLTQMVQSRVEGNTAAVAGGIAGVGSVVLLTASVTSNRATPDNRGILRTANVILTTSTVAANSGAWVGGISSIGATRLNLATVVDNPITQAGTANVKADSGLESFGSIVALPSGPAGAVSCDAAPATTHGYNFDGDGSCALRAPTDRRRGGDPRLLVLVGGYRVPLAGSPVLDRIPVGNADCGGIDQRGLQRPRGDGCDIGAIER